MADNEKIKAAALKFDMPVENVALNVDWFLEMAEKAFEKGKREAEAEMEDKDNYITDLEEELENLTEYIRVLILKITGKKEETQKIYYRTCDVCQKGMNSGYIVDDNEYFCSDECLHKRYTEEEYQEMHKNDVAYWTEWEE